MLQANNFHILKGFPSLIHILKTPYRISLINHVSPGYVKWMAQYSHKQKSPTYPQTSSPHKIGRKWNVPLAVQQGLRQAIFHGPDFKKTIFSIRYPIQVGMEEKQATGQLLGLSSTDLHAALEKMTVHELFSFLEDVALCGLQHNLHPQISSVISEVCMHRLATISLIEQLRLTDILHQIGCLSDNYMETLYQSLTTNWETITLDKRYVLQILFYIGIYRSAPALLLEKIEAYLSEKGHELNGQQVGLMCHSFFACNRAIYKYSILQMIAERTLKDIDNMTLQMVCNVMKVMRQADYSITSFYKDIGTKLSNSNLFETNRSLPFLSNITNAYSAARISQPELFAAVSKSFCKLFKKTSNSRVPRIKDIARFLWSCQSLQQSLPDMLLDELEKQVEDSNELLFRYPEAFIQSVLVLAMANRFPPKAINAIFSPRNMNRLTGRSLDQVYQLLMLNTLVGISCPKYSGNRLSTEHVKTLRSERDSKRELALQTRLGLAATWLILEDLLGGPDKIHCHYITDFSFIPDLEILLDGEGRPCSVHQTKDIDSDKIIKDQLRKQLSIMQASPSDEGVLAQLLREHNRDSERPTASTVHLKPTEKDDSFRKVTIKVLSENQYMVNEPLLLGSHQIEMQTLTKLGYEVLMISPTDAARIGQTPPRDRKGLVQSLVLNKLGVEVIQ